jgi:hypothetical protein
VSVVSEVLTPMFIFDSTIDEVAVVPSKEKLLLF